MAGKHISLLVHFKEEFLTFLDKYEIEYDERYLWD